MIRKLPSGKYRLYSLSISEKTGKRKILGTFNTRTDAVKRERQIQYFKHLRKNPKRKHNPTSESEQKQLILRHVDKIERVLMKFDAVFDIQKYITSNFSCDRILDYYNTFLKYFADDLIGIWNPNHRAIIRYEQDIFSLYVPDSPASLLNVQTSLSQLNLIKRSIKHKSFPVENLERFSNRLEELAQLIEYQYKIFFDEIRKCNKSKRNQN